MTSKIIYNNLAVKQRLLHAVETVTATCRLLQELTIIQQRTVTLLASIKNFD